MNRMKYLKTFENHSEEDESARRRELSEQPHLQKKEYEERKRREERSHKEDPDGMYPRNDKRYDDEVREAKVVIKSKINPKVKYRNKFVARIEFMYGDADGKGFDEYSFDTEEKLSEFALFCKKCIATYSNSGRGNESYDIVPGWDEMIKANKFSPHYCPEAYGDGEASWEGVEFFYYDENGIKSGVSVEFSPEEQAEIDAQSDVSWENYNKIKQSMKKSKKLDNNINKVLKDKDYYNLKGKEMFGKKWKDHK